MNDNSRDSADETGAQCSNGKDRPEEYLEMLREQEAESRNDDQELRGDGMPTGSPPPEEL